MHTYQVLMMRPYEFVTAYAEFDDLSDLQYMATGIKPRMILARTAKL